MKVKVRVKEIFRDKYTNEIYNKVGKILEVEEKRAIEMGKYVVIVKENNTKEEVKEEKTDEEVKEENIEETKKESIEENANEDIKENKEEENKETKENKKKDDNKSKAEVN